MLPPGSSIEIVILPALAVFFGALIYALGLRSELVSHEPAKWKWVGVAILALGAYAGFGAFWLYVGTGLDSQLYRDGVPGRRMLAAHLSGFLIPALTVLGILGYELWWRHRPLREEE